MPDSVDVTVDQRSPHLPPPDPTVRLPESVRKAAEKANAYYQPNGSTPPEPAPAPVEVAPATAPIAPALEPAPEPAPAPAKEGGAEFEHSRYLSMKGRYDQSQRTIGTLQQQLTELGDELMRTQSMIREAPRAAQPPPPPLLTPEDVQQFGPELIDLTQRAAVAALQPKLSELEADNARLRQQVSKTERHTMNSILDAQVPDWREVNSNPRWLQWLRLPDVYSGRVRQQLLNEATAAGDAARIVSFFRGFLAEEHATGRTDPTPTAARAPAVQLEQLASPGRPRPASGTEPTPTGTADKPIITRAQISEFYRLVRQGAYRGQETVKAQHERLIFDAQRDGRVR